MRLEKIELSDLWSYPGPSKTVVGAFGQVNVVIGRNNVGKSNLMRAIRWVKDEVEILGKEWSTYRPKKQVIFNPGENRREMAPSLRVTFSLDAADWKGRTCGEVLFKLCKRDSKSIACRLELGFETADGRGLFVDALPSDAELFAKCCDDIGVEQSSAKDDLQKQGLTFIRERLILLDGWRRLSDPIEDAPNFFEFLHRLQATIEDPQAAFVCQQRVQKFFCELTGLRNVQINVRDDKHGFNVAVNGRNMPLSSYGDGISHLFMIAAKAAVYDRTVILIEEPETHLHPDLQRHLLRFLMEMGSVQVILTTHSPVLLNNPWVDKVIRVDHAGEGSFLKPVETSKSVYAVLDDIGARASDILQANVVIWVEGPSDRIFLKRCLGLMAKHFSEGLHFQVVCYGGVLRAYLTFDENLEALINLLRLSRHVVMVCDADRESAADDLNETKERLMSECRKIGGLYWITEGREIENYLNDEVLTRSYRQLLKNDALVIQLGQYQRLGDVVRKAIGKPRKGERWKSDYDNHKPELMKFIMDNVHTADELNRYDLKTRLNEIAEFIARANNYQIAQENA